ncbi:hypothetical protein MJN76_34695, partial [Salmonella enterica subsp. enterica serovar Anatum]|nr:hypothetical protein [Salmonella enterica subsp. enterica serovar Anatum]
DVSAGWSVNDAALYANTINVTNNGVLDVGNSASNALQVDTLKNPVEATRIPEIKVARERLQLETYNATRTAAEHLPVWFPLA